MEKVCVYVSSPESYSDVFYVFLKCFEQNWKDCSFPVFISTNKAKEMPERYFCKTYDLENDNWVTRTIASMAEISAEYILLLMDDSIITKPVSSDEINRIVADMDKYGLNYCKLTATGKGSSYKESLTVNKVKKSTPYAKNIFMGIYRRTFLLQELGNGSMSAWDIERKWLTEAANANKKEYFDDIVLAKKKPITAFNAVVAGKWLPSIKRKIEKTGIQVGDERETVSRARELRMLLGARLGSVLPPKLRLKLKSIMSRFGIKFASKM